MKVEINRNILIAMEGVSSRDSSRFVLYHTINIEVSKNTCIVTATDGRRLATVATGIVLVKPTKKVCLTLRIPHAMLRALPKSKQCGINVILSYDETSEAHPNPVTFLSDLKSENSFSVDPVEGTFPKWRQIVPTKLDRVALSPTFNWRLLEGIVKCAEVIQGKNGDFSSPGLTLYQADAISAMVARFGSVPNFIGVIMPMRVDDPSAASLPEWLNEATDVEPAIAPPAPVAPEAISPETQVATLQAAAAMPPA